MNIPLILTISRFVMSLLIFYLVIVGNYFVALILFLLSGFTDYLDGYFARKLNQESVLGEILDPAADKVLIVFLFFAISITLDSAIVGFLSALIISREIWVSVLRDFNSRTNNSKRTKVLYLAKIKTTIQLMVIALYLLALTLNNSMLIVLTDISLFIATAITLYTGYIYTVDSFSKKNE